jgi:hypothetical protein
MIKTHIGSTDICVCESTAQCIVYNPTETLANQIAEFVFSNNYTCTAIYHETAHEAMHLQRMIGGVVITDADEIVKYENNLC